MGLDDMWSEDTGSITMKLYPSFDELGPKQKEGMAKLCR